jgi:hypothetical protein
MRKSSQLSVQSAGCDLIDFQERLASDMRRTVSDPVRRKPGKMGGNAGGTNVKVLIESSMKSDRYNESSVVPFTTKRRQSLLINWLAGILVPGAGVDWSLPIYLKPLCDMYSSKYACLAFREAATLLRREAVASDVANQVAFLASPESSFIVGAGVDVNSGMFFS